MYVFINMEPRYLCLIFVAIFGTVRILRANIDKEIVRVGIIIPHFRCILYSILEERRGKGKVINLCFNILQTAFSHPYGSINVDYKSFNSWANFHLNQLTGSFDTSEKIWVILYFKAKREISSSMQNKLTIHPIILLEPNYCSYSLFYNNNATVEKSTVRNALEGY